MDTMQIVRAYNTPVEDGGLVRHERNHRISKRLRQAVVNGHYVLVSKYTALADVPAGPFLFPKTYGVFDSLEAAKAAYPTWPVVTCDPRQVYRDHDNNQVLPTYPGGNLAESMNGWRHVLVDVSTGDIVAESREQMW